jgi:hypothetical protein
MHQEQILAWRFLTIADEVLVSDERSIVIASDASLSSNRLYASRFALDALAYLPGPIVCRVAVWGDVQEVSDEEVNLITGRNHSVLAAADAQAVLHMFAYRCAEQALRVVQIREGLCWEALQVKQAWLDGTATNDALDSARAVVRDVVNAEPVHGISCAASATAAATVRDDIWTAAVRAAREAANAAAWAAVWEGARGGDWTTFWATTWEHSWNAHNADLEQLLLVLQL